jgi:Ca-activated chloride channel family protein
MIQILPTLSDEEIRRCQPADEDSGFGALTSEKGPLPLKALDVRTRIDGLLARTTVCQTFVNTMGEPLEATYIFPLPDRAAVTSFRMEVAGRVIEAALKERGEARREYDQAVQEGKRAAITEEERPGVFTLRVGNLMPGEEAVLRLTMTGPLTYSDGEATFRFPLVVAPRYIPGTPLTGPSVGEGVVPDTDAVPDASRISPPVLLPGFPNPVRLSLAVEVHGGGLPVGDFQSSLHAVVVEEHEGAWKIAVQPGERLNRDFILRFRIGEKNVRTSMVLQPDAEGKEGTFLLTLVPPVGQALKQKPRDAVFILDRSGSMGGWKMVAARRALARMVDTLTDRDRFTVYAFDDKVETPPAFGNAELVQATDRNRFRAVEFLARVDARGGTELARPLDQAVTTLAGEDANRDRILILVTDGQVGNEDQILKNLGDRLRNLRIFTLGIDQAVNEGFLKRLALVGGGACELVESEDRLDAVMDKVHRRIGTPILTSVRLEAAGLKLDPHSVVPDRLPDLFAGSPLLIQGRFHGAANGSITLQASDVAGRAWSETVAGRRTDNAAVTSTWARSFVRGLEDRYAAGRGDPSKLEKQIVEISLRFGVLCRFTAFIAVDVKEVVNPGGEVHRMTQPVEPAAGWAMLGTGEQEDASQMVACLGAAGTPAYGASLRFRLSPRAKMKGSGRLERALGKLSRVFRGEAPQPLRTEALESLLVDLAAYRGRAIEMLHRLQETSGADPAKQVTSLAVLAVELAALIEDLKSVGAPEQEIRPLEDLLKELHELAAEKGPDQKRVAQLWTRAEEVLLQFGGGAEVRTAKSSPRRKGFWK